jgi:hypothetical protein
MCAERQIAANFKKTCKKVSKFSTKSQFLNISQKRSSPLKFLRKSLKKPRGMPNAVRGELPGHDDRSAEGPRVARERILI